VDALGLAVQVVAQDDAPVAVLDGRLRRVAGGGVGVNLVEGRGDERGIVTVISSGSAGNVGVDV
jgi:hypothetical protein